MFGEDVISSVDQVDPIQSSRERRLFALVFNFYLDMHRQSGINLITIKNSNRTISLENHAHHWLG